MTFSTPAIVKPTNQNATFYQGPSSSSNSTLSLPTNSLFLETPEPGTVGLVGLALALVAWRARKR
jgi:hypothetical protein